MPFGPHGDYQVSRTGEIIIIKFIHSWNMEGAKAFHESYKSFVIENNLTRFGVLSDLNDLAGGTPDAIEYFSFISDWAEKQGQIARALILNTSLKEYTIKSIDQGLSRFPICQVDNYEQAFDWFESLGLSTS